MQPKRFAKISLWTFGCLGVLAVVADIQGTLDFVDKSVLPFIRHSVPIGVALLILAIGCLGAFAIGYYLRPDVVRDDPSSILTEGHYYEHFQTLLVKARQEIRIVGLTKDWVFPLMLSTFVARTKGVNVEVVCEDGTHERYKLLEKLGCRIQRIESTPPIAGVLSDPLEILHCRAAIVCERRHTENIYARFYYGSLDSGAIRSCNAQIPGFSNPSLDADRGYIPELVEYPERNIIETLSQVRVYEGAKFEIAEVVIEKLLTVSTQIIKYKLQQIDNVLNLYSVRNWSFFKPCGIRLSNGRISPLVPPVVEEHDGRLCIAEGHTRLFRLRQKKITTATVVVVRSVSQRLPMKPGPWSKVQLADVKTERRDSQFARYIESSTHKNLWDS